MMTNPIDHLATGQSALKTAHWPEAKNCFEIALKEPDDAKRLMDGRGAVAA
jgi:uncharacterized protein HemY